MMGFEVFSLLMMYFIFFAVLVESSTTQNSLLDDETLGTSGKCNIRDLIPGLYKMQLGVEISELELHPNDVIEKFGFRKQLFMFTCNKNQTWENIGNNVRYPLPDQLYDPMIYRLQAHNAKTSFTRDSSEYRFSLGVQFGGSFEEEEIGFGSSTSMKYFEKKTTAETVYSHQIFSAVPSVTFMLAESSLPPLAPDFVDSINKLPSSWKKEDDLMEYMKLFLDFGTHYFEEQRTGGLCYQEYNIDSMYVAKNTEFTIERNSEASFFGLFKINQGLNLSYGTVDESFKESSTLRWVIAGGSGSPMLSSSSNTTEDLAASTQLGTHFDDWANSLYDFPFTIGGTLKPIHNLIQDNEKKIGVEQTYSAYRQYIKNVMARRRYQNIKDKDMLSLYLGYCMNGKYNPINGLGKKLASDYSLEEFVSDYSACTEDACFDGDKLLEYADYLVDHMYMNETFSEIVYFYDHLSKSCITSCKKEIQEFRDQRFEMSCKRDPHGVSILDTMPLNRDERSAIRKKWRELELKYIEPL